jgi:hypothetical protein
VADSHVVGFTSKFPRQWKTLCGVKLDHYYGYSKSAHIWNPDHPIISNLDSEGWDWCAKAFSKSLDPMPVRNELFSKRSRASAWVVLCLRSQANELWDGLKDRGDRAFLNDLWELLFADKKGKKGKEITISHWVQSVVDSRLRILSPSGWAAKYENKENLKEFEKYLPDPAIEDKVIVHNNLGRRNPLKSLPQR